MIHRSDISREISAEMLKFRRRRSTFVFPAALVLLAALLYIGFEAGARNHWFGVPSGFFVAASSVAWIANVMVLVLVVITSFVISQDYALGTVKSAWVRPTSRTGWYTGKVLTACCVVAGLFVLAVVAVVVLAASRLGFVDLMEKDYLVHSASSMGLRLLLTTGLTLFVMWSAVVVTSALAAGLNHPGGAIAVALGLGVAMTALSVFPATAPFLLTTYLGLPSEQMVAMSKGLPLPLEWADLIWRSLGAGASWALVAFVIGRKIVIGKEITN
ncbi:MAG: ABC transporter permease [Candidatus Krumholzibacteria bacterium]|nr:ABC transporter permease [Candidatus Krumholzibacteria bacterium]